MVTEITPQLQYAAQKWQKDAGYPSAVLSGILPNAEHLRDGGPHVSIEDLKRYGNYPDYSTPDPLGRPPAVKNLRAGSAIDMTVNKADMVKMHGRVLKVWQDHTDPRRRFINAINVWDGVTGHLPDRFNFQTNQRAPTDRSHEWHGHADFVRSRWDQQSVGKPEADKAARAFVSLISGESKVAWIAREEPIPITEEDDMKCFGLIGHLPTTIGGRSSEALMPVNSGLLAWGPAYMSVSADLFGGTAAFRLAIWDAAGVILKIYEEQRDSSGRLINDYCRLDASRRVWTAPLPTGSRGFSAVRVDSGVKDSAHGPETPIGWGIEYAPRV